MPGSERPPGEAGGAPPAAQPESALAIAAQQALGILASEGDNPAAWEQAARLLDAAAMTVDLADILGGASRTPAGLVATGGSGGPSGAASSAAAPGEAQAASAASGAAAGASAAAGGSAGSAASASGGGAGGGNTRADRAGNLVGFDQAPSGADQAAWSRLSDRVRRGVRHGGADAFTAEHRIAIRAYLERLAAEE